MMNITSANKWDSEWSVKPNHELILIIAKHPAKFYP
jgi:hypothetical protein